VSEARGVTFLTSGLTRGGAETQLVRVARELRGRGWRVEVICLSGPAAFVDELAASEIPVLYLGMGGAKLRLSPLVRLLRHLRVSRPDALVCFMYHANIVGRVIGRLARVPAIVASIRNERMNHRVQELVERITEPLSSCVTTNSDRVAANLVRRGVVSRARICVIPNCLDAGPDAAVDREGLRSELGAASEDFLWLAAGRLHDQKDFPRLLRALEIVRAERGRVGLAIAGDGPLLGSLEDEARRLQLSDCVKFLGLRGDLRALMRCADGFVLSSAWEGLPNVLMEAALSALPVVATQVGGVGELVQDGDTGVLVVPSDTEALAAGMLRMMALPRDRRTEMAERGGAVVRSRYGVESVIDRWEEFLRGLPRAASRR
jgi:glycosyltransferase involved in cell wall biosynthesis